MQRVSLFGYGKTTKAIAKRIPHATFYDDKVTKPFRDEDGFMVKPSSEFNPKYSNLEIPSPGIPPSNALIKKAKNLISDYDFFANSAPLSVWISGTNGKTTTTQMMQFLLQDKGSQEGGNIGTPLADLYPHASMWILETSSFTMHYTTKAKPNIYVLLPLSPDHISWHGSMDEYVKAKLKPLEMMCEGEIAILPHAYKDVKTKAHLITYTDEKDIAQQFGIEQEKIKFKGAFLADALLAMAVDKILFDRIDYEKINSFVIDPHRQEELRDSKNRLWVNDTKATNLDATIAALKRYQDSFIHLILGGDDKGVDLDELFVFMQNLQLKIYAIGSNEERLVNLCKKYNLEILACGNLLTAVEAIDKALQEDEVALLSPAAASLDQFTSYAQRGDMFKEAVRKLL
ncbi:MAG: UDP-N-acetylmuramoyl-L-alanine--D-glutamate ligase [Sulfurimonas sp.]|jgi:UDP-N-acetylmuramoylalanine--D-glutamate ligase